MKYKFIEHTADIKFQAYGKNLAEVFSNSAEALVKTICDEKIKGKIEKKIKVKGHDLESLMYNFLEELLFLLDSEKFLFSKVSKILINEKKFVLEAIILGDCSVNYSFYLDIKAITYNEMFVYEKSGKWTAQITLDV